LLTTDGGTAWVVDDRFLSSENGTLERLPMTLDDFALEDFSGAVRLSGQLTSVQASLGPFGGSSSDIEALSGERLPLTGTRVPLSRGLACPSLGTPCPLTDGDLTAADAGGAQALTLTLPTPTPLSAVVVRAADLDVEWRQPGVHPTPAT
jgi:hypothetical protein